MNGFTGLVVRQQMRPAVLGGQYLEAPYPRRDVTVDGAALRDLSRVISRYCMPVFGHAIQLLTKGSAFGPDLFTA